MILEVAILNVKHGMAGDFEVSFEEAQLIFSEVEGYISHQLQKSVDKLNRYILLVYWKTVDDHEVGFRQSQSYQRWKSLLHHFYDPFPSVVHFKKLYEGADEKGA